jgi:hypothetical protein
MVLVRVCACVGWWYAVGVQRKKTYKPHTHQLPLLTHSAAGGSFFSQLLAHLGNSKATYATDRNGHCNVPEMPDMQQANVIVVSPMTMQLQWNYGLYFLTHLFSGTTRYDKHYKVFYLRVISRFRYCKFISNYTMQLQ